MFDWYKAMISELNLKKDIICLRKIEILTDMKNILYKIRTLKNKDGIIAKNYFLEYLELKKKLYRLYKNT